MTAYIMLQVALFVDANVIWPLSHGTGPSFLVSWFTFILKLILHHLTGLGEVQRSLSAQLCGARMAFEFESILKRSTVLINEYQQLVGAYGSECRDKDIEAIGRKIGRKKRVPLKGRDWETLKRYLRCIVGKHALIQCAKAATIQPYPMEESLERLWKALRPADAHIPPIPSEEWKELGFQGNDPASDLRAMGPLALMQLVDFAETCDQAETIYREAQYGESWYSFAAVSINVTATIFNYLIDGRLDEVLYKSCTLQPDLWLLNYLHAELLALFHQKWREGRPTNLLVSFNRIYADACTAFATQLSNAEIG